ncbi:MAG TPA: gamma carbonic anhydrase family protein [Thermotogota bacterium]|nr:gamma carbonic anhydrase family protein [Thermotogota bacterium]
MIISYQGKKPTIHPDTFIAPTATIIGDVVIEKGANIWYGAVLRGDMAPIKVGENSNIQDNVTIHTDTGVPTIVGKNCTVGHNAVLHGCTLKDYVLIGISAILLNKSIVESGAIIAAGSLVKEGQQCKGCCLYAGIPSLEKKTLTHSIEQLQNHADYYVNLSVEHRKEQDL